MRSPGEEITVYMIWLQLTVVRYVAADSGECGVTGDLCCCRGGLGSEQAVPRDIILYRIVVNSHTCLLRNIPLVRQEFPHWSHYCHNSVISVEIPVTLL